MKILNFGSLNYDYTYKTDHFVLPKETLSSFSYMKNYGGKGLNQSIALSRAKMNVYHAGKVGSDGNSLINLLKNNNVNTDFIFVDEKEVTGHAIIEVCNGENRILLYGGANQNISEKDIDDVLANFDKDDVLLLQNEINNISYLISKAYEKGMKIIMNVAPFNDDVFTYPLELIDMYVVNEAEASGLLEENFYDFEKMKDTFLRKYRDKQVLLTLGEHGAYFLDRGEEYYKEAIKTEVVDTTAAGDTFLGYFLSSYLNDNDALKALDLATKASSITISRSGAAVSIPYIGEIK